jgi:hypothetical protein
MVSFISRHFVLLDSWKIGWIIEIGPVRGLNADCQFVHKTFDKSSYPQNTCRYNVTVPWVDSKTMKGHILCLGQKLLLFIPSERILVPLVPRVSNTFGVFVPSRIKLHQATPTSGQRLWLSRKLLYNYRISVSGEISEPIAWHIVNKTFKCSIRLFIAWGRTWRIWSWEINHGGNITQDVVHYKLVEQR